MVYRVVGEGGEGGEQMLLLSEFFTKLTKLTLRKPCDVDEALRMRDESGRWRGAAQAALRIGCGLVWFESVI